MSVARVLQAVEIFRANGVPVTFEPGWETRGNGQSSDYQGGIVHHTGGAYNATCPGILIYGRSDLAGPLCNFAGLSGGGIHVVAAHPANHAGASGGPSNGPFPVTTLFNKLVWGLEICYPGSSSMTNEQYRTALVFAKVNRVLFGDIERCRAHAETSREGKWDPGFAPGTTINMSAFRTEAQSIQEGDLTPEESRKLNEIHEVVGASYPPGLGHRVNVIDDRTKGMNEALGQAYDPATGIGIGDRVEAIEAKVGSIEGGVAQILTALSGLQTGTGFTLEQIASATADEQDRRARDNNPDTGPRT